MWGVCQTGRWTTGASSSLSVAGLCVGVSDGFVSELGLCVRTGACNERYHQPTFLPPRPAPPPRSPQPAALHPVREQQPPQHKHSTESTFPQDWEVEWLHCSEGAVYMHSDVNICSACKTWAHSDLDLWPLVTKTYSAHPWFLMYTCRKFQGT